MSAVALPTQRVQSSTMSFNVLVPTNIGEALQLADVMSKAQLVPEHLQGKPGDCLLVIMQAQRWGMDAVSVAQCTSVVHGRLCYEGKLVAAALYAMGAIEGRLHYEIQGSGANATITVTGTPRGGKGPQSVTGSVKDWRTYGKNKQGEQVPNAWDSIPEDMLVYRGTRQWARRYAPEALLGVYTPDELEEQPPMQTVQGRTIEPEKPAGYSDEEFQEHLATWTALIQSGKTTADRLIAKVSSKVTLTENQKQAIRAVKKEAETPEEQQ